MSTMTRRLTHKRSFTLAMTFQLLLALGTDLRAATAEDLSKGEPLQTIEIQGIPFVLIPGGEYRANALPATPGMAMLSASEATNQSDVMKLEQKGGIVKVKEFWISRHEITQDIWSETMESKPWKHAACKTCPVENVSWEEVQVYINKLSDAAGVRFRLPTSDEWQYAATGGGDWQRWSGTSDENNLGDFAWYKKNSEDDVQKVCRNSENRFLLCDMNGNVGEWVSDIASPLCPTCHRMMGGSYRTGAWEMLWPKWLKPDGSAEDVGFRLAISKE